MTKQISKSVERLFAILLAVVLLFSVMPISANAVETNSDGYIEVKTVQDLYNIRLDLTAKYILMNDIDLTAATAEGGDWDFMGNGWNPIGSDDVYGKKEFSGELDGNGYSIIGMRIDVTTLPEGKGSNIYCGLFSYITGSVHDLTFEAGSIDITIQQSKISVYAGSLAGASAVATITNIQDKMNAISVVSNSYYNNTHNYCGGIIGYASNSTVRLCSNYSNIYSFLSSCNSSYSNGHTPHNSYVGGIVGNAYYGTKISECYNTGDLTSEGEYRSSSTSYYSSAYAGGICSSFSSEGSYNSDITVTDCYNSGVVKVLGGYAYHSYGIGGYTVQRCYNVGKVFKKSALGVAIGGQKVTNSYYIKGSGENNSGATQHSETQMIISSVFATFDFENVWTQNSNAHYPYPQIKNSPQDLRIIKDVSIATEPAKKEYKFGEKLNMTGAVIKVEFDDGTYDYIDVTDDMVSGFNSENPGTQSITVTYRGFVNVFDVLINEKVYIPIYTIEDLYNIRDDLNSNYILMNDIDLTKATAKGGDWDYNGCGWNPIGSNDQYQDGAFSGEFDGNGHSIIGMRIDLTKKGTLYVGLFAKVTGYVHDLTFKDGSISLGEIEIDSTSKVFVGALAGYSDGAKIENIKNNMGKIYANSATINNTTGGIIGYANNSNISLCSNSSPIFASADFYLTVGSTGAKSGNAYVGGICGTAADTSVSLSYNTGNISAKGDYISSSNSYGYNNTSCYCGGITGCLGTVINCYNTGKISAQGIKSGYNYSVGIGGSTIKTCYNVGKVNGQARSGENENCYYLTDSGEGNRGTALTETQMKIQSMYKGFDFENVWILNEFANHPYPQLKENIQDMNESAKIVSIIAIPQKTEYLTDDTLDFTGGMVKVVYVSGKEELIDITDSMVSGFDMSISGEQTVTVTVAGASDTYTVNVSERPVVESVIIENQPNCKEFAVGTAFDFTGATAKISYVGGATETVDITYEMTTGGNINHIGKQTITYTYKEKSATFEVEVVGISLEKIEITQLPEKLNYIEGQSLDLTGMVVTAVMNNGIKSTLVSGYTVSGYSDQIGEHTVTVSYLGKTVAFNVNVAKKTLLSLKLNSLPDKTEYISGESFDKSGIQVVATYDNGEICVVEDYTVSGFDATPGIKNVIISLDGKSVSFAVKVIARVVTEFKLTSLPSKLDYIEYESFDTTGLKAEATYNDGSTEDVTDYELSGFTSNVGTHTVMVAYKGFVKSFDITVSPRELVDVKVTAPTKTTYTIGEEFDSTGMKVIACYNNGQEFEIDSYTMTGFNSLSAGAKEIVITYGGITRKFAVTVAKKSVVKTDGSIKLDSVKGRLGETVEVPVTITKNTGVTAMCHTITFNPNTLKFVSATAKNGFANGTVVVNDEKAANGEVTVLWFQATDVVESGVAYTLKFEILETAQDGNSSISIAFDENDNGNASGENVVFEAVNGGVEVLSYWLGDLDGDRKYGMADLLQLAQYVSGKEMALTEKQKKSADVNEDGVIDVHDVTLLSQWLLTADM